MRLKELYLDHRVLKELTIPFTGEAPVAPGSDQAGYGLDFLVGVNGTGKSTVLKALLTIFRHMEVNRAAPFPFRLEYALGTGEQRREVVVQYERPAGESPRLITTVNGDEVPSPSEVVPKIIAFTTGGHAEWQEPEHDDRGTSPEEKQRGQVRYIPPEDLPLVMLCGWLNDIRSGGERPLRQTLQECGFERITGFSLRFRLHSGRADVAEADLIEFLAARGSRRLRMGTDRLIVFDLSDEQAAAAGLFERFGTGQNLFENLAALKRPTDTGQPLLQEVNIFVERQRKRDRDANPVGPVPDLHLFNWLSDGEQSFLGRMALFALLGDSEALILLDEPEVHFNDYWKREVVHHIHRALVGKNSHVLVTTHSSVALTDVGKEHIRILHRDGSHTERSEPPGIETFGAEPGDIMTHVFGTPETNGRHSTIEISRVLGMLAQDAPQQRLVHLRAVEEWVAPGYWSYRIGREILRLERERRR
ncbi:MAG: AAA family ATPase [Bacillota bacterium]